MKILEHPFSVAVLGKQKSSAKDKNSFHENTRTIADGVSISSKQKLKELLKEVTSTEFDETDELDEISASMDGDCYLPSADDVADAILDEMSLLGDLYQWSNSADI